MEYSKIISVTGFGGLFELLSSKSDGAIVRSLDDKTTRFVSSRQHNFSHLESIEIFTVRDNVNLAEVFLEMQKNSTPLPDTKDNAAVKKYFEAVYPDIDFERVYTSDMKKMVKWLEILSANNIEIKAPEAGEEAESTPAAAEVQEEAVEEEKPKKAAKKKAEPAAEKAAATAEDAPKKKAAAKKTAAATTKEEAPKKKAAKKKTDSK
ncbi:MAG: DUF5606 domain-containing protein [Sphingobacteriales bacterium]|nr:DUF5606 domain-containing protein [Sphingobacteriales bacterium]OJY81233.1 MAG: hypothetical protein BGP14_07565 [Sphingobacteriales bacterium 44-15]